MAAFYSCRKTSWWLHYREHGLKWQKYVANRRLILNRNRFSLYSYYLRKWERRVGASVWLYGLRGEHFFRERVLIRAWALIRGNTNSNLKYSKLVEPEGNMWSCSSTVVVSVVLRRTVVHCVEVTGVRQPERMSSPESKE